LAEDPRFEPSCRVDFFDRFFLQLRLSWVQFYRVYDYVI